MLGFFDTLYWSRKFKRHMELKRSARMTVIPQLGVPEILVYNEEERSSGEASGRAASQTFSTTRGATGPGGFLSADGAHQSWTAPTDLSSFDTSYGHPLSAPRATGATTPSHRNQTSAFSFELQEPVGETGGEGTAGNSRRTSSVRPAQVREMLDDTAWMDSIRRSATIRRDNW